MRPGIGLIEILALGHVLFLTVCLSLPEAEDHNNDEEDYDGNN